MKKTVVIILPSLQHGGVPRSLLEAMRVIDTEKYNITIYVYRMNNAWKEYMPSNIRVIVDIDRSHYYRKPIAIYLQIRILLEKLFRNRNNVNRLANRLHAYVHENKAKYPAKRYFSNGVDVAISYTMGLCTDMVLNIPARKHYVFFHSSDYEFHRDISERCFAEFDGIIAVGNRVQQMLKAHFPQYSDKIFLIRNYIDIESIRRLANEYNVAYKKSEKMYVFASVMRVDKEKGADLVVRAAARLKEWGISYVWFIVGDGSEKNKVKQQIEDNELSDYVIIEGFKDNPYPYIKCCDVYVHPAYEESFGLSILEALYLGKTIVSTDTMGAREVLDDGTAGVIVPIDAEAIAKGILALIGHPDMKAGLLNRYQFDNDMERSNYKNRWEAMLNGEKL